MGKTRVIFTFGRFNPPTIGHAKLINSAMVLGHMKNADVRIYVSHSQDRKKNPLPHAEKVKFLKQLFPRADIVSNNTTRNIFDIVKELVKIGYKDITMIVGEDRTTEFERMIQKYQSELGYEKFSVVSAGARSGGFVASASATKMRGFVKKGDFQSFLRFAPTKDKRLAREIFDTTKRYLGESVIARKKSKKAKYKKKIERKFGVDGETTYNTVPADAVSSTAGYGQMFSAFHRLGESVLARYLNRQK